MNRSVELLCCPQALKAGLMSATTRPIWLVRLPLHKILLVFMPVAVFKYMMRYSQDCSERLKTLPIGLQLLVFGDVYPWGQLMSASLLMAIPVMLIYIYAQRYLIEGLTMGSVKG